MMNELNDLLKFLSRQELAEMDRLIQSQETFRQFYCRTIPASWTIPRHIDFLLDVCNDLVSGKRKKVIVNLPPGHAKSSTITHRLPVYWAKRNPGTVALVTGYSQTFAEANLSAPAREIARELGLTAGADAMEEWHLANKSRVVARGVGSPPTGVNPIHLIVIDDPIKSAEQALSEVQRKAVQQWHDGSIVQRFWPDTRSLVIATRWHEDDLPGYLLQSDPEYHHINLPAIAEANDPLGREPGEALWPEAKPLEFLEKLRKQSPLWFEALFQGKPSPPSGKFFHPDKLLPISPGELPPMVRRVRAWDLATTQGGGDYTVGVLLGIDAMGRIYILDVVRDQLGPDLRDNLMVTTARADGPGVQQRIPVEPGPAGKPESLRIIRMLAPLDVQALPVGKAKEIRATGAASQVNAGAVFMVRGHWNHEFREELRTFPTGKHDDQVDAFSDAFNQLSTPNFVFVSA